MRPCSPPQIRPLVGLALVAALAVAGGALAARGGTPDSDTMARPPAAGRPAGGPAVAGRGAAPAPRPDVVALESGVILGARTLPAGTACDAVGAEEAVAGVGALRAREGALRSGEPALELEANAETRLTLVRFVLETAVTRALDLDLRFSTGSRADGGAFAVRLDGRVLACGEATEAALDVLASGEEPRLATALRTLELPLEERLVKPGRHVLEALVTIGTEASGSAWLAIGGVRLSAPGEESLVDPCRPAPPEALLEIADPSSTTQRWIFDDNKYCPAGPGINCARSPVDPNPGTAFVDSTGLSFEMYVVADCGAEMHVPLFDVESGCISVFHEDPLPPFNRTPVAITVSNPFGFNQSGGEVCWSASDCNGLNPPGGPGDLNTMDVRFEGTPTLCGVYVVNFRSWAGCIWDLLANCNGSDIEQFQIFDNVCQARTSVNPLPELLLQNLTTADHGDCSVDWCVDVHNIGCASASPTTLHAQNADGSQDLPVPPLGAGATVQLCGNLPVSGMGPGVLTTVTVTVDPANTLLECSEAPNSSSCSPTSGADTLSRTQSLDCNLPPVCNAGGPYVAECAAATGGTHVPLDGSASFDPEGSPLVYAWTTDCPGATFDDPSVAQPVLTVPGPTCLATCNVGLTVTDPLAASASCASTVTIRDTTPPVVTSTGDDLHCLWPPNHWYVCFTPEMLLPEVTDACSTATWSIVGCASSQCDEAPCADHPGENGDGNTTEDCVVLPGGQGVCARSERAGTDPAGRRYGILAAAVDACGNAGPPVPIGSIYVPHDQSPHERSCLDPTKVGCRPNQAIPCTPRH